MTRSERAPVSGSNDARPIHARPSKWPTTQTEPSRKTVMDAYVSGIGGRPCSVVIVSTWALFGSTMVGSGVASAVVR
jgi:hypothetical protein